MNKLFISILCITAFVASIHQIQAQTPFINYQASVQKLDISNKLIPVPDGNQSVIVTLYKDSIFRNSSVVYQESHTNVAVKNGLVNLQIGKGEQSFGSPTFESLKWLIDKPYYVKIDYPTLSITGSLKQLGVVPYALSTTSSDWKNSGDTAIYRLNGNVGIGIDKPIDKLHIQGSLRQSVGNDFVYHMFSNQNRTKYFELNPAGDFYLFDKNNLQYNFIAKTNGNIGIGTSNPQDKLTVVGGIGVGSRIFPGRTGTENGYSLVHFKNGTDQNGGIIRASKGDEDMANAPLVFQAKSHEFQGGNVSITTNNPALTFRHNNGKAIYWEMSSGGEYYLFEPARNEYRLFFHPNGNVGIGTSNPKQKLDVNGTASVSVLEVRGADIIEKAQNTEGVQAGEVVVIDPTQPNQVKRSQKAYDKTVVGVVSGAGGIKHGMQLAQEGMLDGNTNFAIAGRVYVKVIGNVEIGDLLTTSDVPGYAMAATDPLRAIGATIGKVWSKPNNEGLVLMLVTTR